MWSLHPMTASQLVTTLITILIHLALASNVTQLVDIACLLTAELIAIYVILDNYLSKILPRQKPMG